MPHSNFKQLPYETNTGVSKCSCGQTFGFLSTKDAELKQRLHCKFCKRPPNDTQKIAAPMKVTRFKEYQADKTMRNREVYS